MPYHSEGGLVKRKRKVIIIGAGPAGLTAAHELLTRASQDFSVTVLEETQAIGGISRTVVHDGNRMDIGGHRFFTKEARVNEWWDERMPMQGAPSFDDKVLGRESYLEPGGPDPEREDRVMLTRHRISRIYYGHHFFNYPVSLSAATLKAMGFGTAMNVGFSYLGSCAHKLPEDSLENFYINRFGRKLYSMFFEGYTEKLWGRHPSKISADWGSQRVKGLSVKAVLKDMVNKASGKKDSSNTETSLIEQFKYPKLGPGQLWEQAASEVEAMGGTIRMGAKVTGVSTSERDGRIVSVTVEGADGRLETVRGDVFCSTMPLKDLVAAMDDVPADPAAIAAGLPYRDFVTVGLLFHRLALKNETDIKTLGDVVPDNWIYVQDSGVKVGRLQIFNNWSPYLVADPEHTVWIGMEFFCDEGDEYWTMSEPDWVELGRKELVKMGVIDADEKILDSHREWVKKAYPAYFDTYDRIDDLIAWLDTHENLFCLGRNGQHRYNNMDHSMMTAFLAVDDILAGSTDRTNVWNVNTDTDYHEGSSSEAEGETEA
jgi:protoporphyrinogen oxidase